MAKRNKAQEDAEWKVTTRQSGRKQLAELLPQERLHSLHQTLGDDRQVTRGKYTRLSADRQITLDLLGLVPIYESFINFLVVLQGHLLRSVNCQVPRRIEF